VGVVLISFILTEKNKKFYMKGVKILADPKPLRCAMNSTAWKILCAISERPSYPAEIAKRLRLHEQIVYYHIRCLEKGGLIYVQNKVERGGALAKYYSPRESAFALELPFGDESLAENPFRKEPKNLKSFLYPFISAGKLNASIVVGSPDPHGAHQVRARDSHYGVDLALFMGQFSEMPSEFVTRLDIDIKAENKYKQNLILIGGVLTNVLTSEFNNLMPARFDMETFPFRKIVSEQTGRSYIDENCGIIAKIINPHDKEKSILIFAGIRFGGTKAAVLGLTRHYETILKNYTDEDNWACVVQGLDMDGDGKIDSVKVMEP